jgi:glycine/D-amino acid oxidase-like deaminating enzyme
MPRHVQVDVAILGGGVLGLWTLARLRSLGYSCVLLEAHTLGAAQSLASQGIIHGGIKYALSGAASKASRAIAEMPGIWRSCLRAEGVLDISGARVLAEHQHLWTAGGFGSRLVGLAASRVLRTGVERVDRPQRPPAFAGASRGTDVYSVEEPVLDTRSVLDALLQAAGGSDWTLQCAADGEGNGPLPRSRGIGMDRVAGFFSGDDPRAALGDIEVRAARYVLTAGAGNDAILRRCGVSVDHANRWDARMQRRPLHMVLLRETQPSHARELPDLFGHCVGGGLSDKPRITITTARDAEGRKVWYIGGQISEEGVARERHDQVDAAKRELRECLPWLPWDRGGLEWATHRVDRAEGLTEDGSRPDEPVVVKVENMLVAWPTKLAFAPAAAEWIRKLLQEDGVTPGSTASPEQARQALDGLPRPALGVPPWDDRSGSVIWTS